MRLLQLINYDATVALTSVNSLPSYYVKINNRQVREAVVGDSYRRGKYVYSLKYVEYF